MGRGATTLLCLFASLLLTGTHTGAHGNQASSFDESRRHLIMEVGNALDDHVTTPCNPELLGSKEACYDSSIIAPGNVDHKWGAPEISYPTDGSPWGVHLTGPYPDGRTYLVSWQTGDAVVGTEAHTRQPDTSKLVTEVVLQAEGDSKATTMRGEVITYQRVYRASYNYSDYNYLSPYIHHVVLKGLQPNTRYTYRVAGRNGTLSAKSFAFTTLPDATSRNPYPLRIGLIGDVGQTLNSTDTRDHLAESEPHVVVHVGDNSYADLYGPTDNDDDETGSGTNQRRWDSHSVLWEKVFSSVPVLNCIGNHEIEKSGINYSINHTTYSFSFPTNYPFQSYAARYPVPGTRSGFGNITAALYYSTILGGRVKLITMNNYVPFHEGTPQYEWAMREFEGVDRKKTPWLVVQFHSPPYHTYKSHYKEMECFRSSWEKVFYRYGVDLVFNGHVHAYERTHGMYDYQPNVCGPMYVTIGDGGNLEGPYRSFIDEQDKRYDDKNVTFCETRPDPNELIATNDTLDWLPSYQARPQPPGCPVLTFQPASSVGSGPVLVPSAADPRLGFCQSSQPLWSAHRDPSFGHALLELTSDSTARLRWFRNQDGRRVAADDVMLTRAEGCSNRGGAPGGSMAEANGGSGRSNKSQGTRRHLRA